MGKEKYYIKISEFRSDALRELAKQHNTTKEKKTLGIKFKGERLDAAEISAFLKDDAFKNLKSEVDQESDDVKELLGFTSSQSTTEAITVGEYSEDSAETARVAELKAAAQKRMAEEKANEAKNADKKEAKEESEKTADEAYKEVREAYLKERGYDPETGKTNGTQSKDAYNKVKKAFKGKGKAYKEAIKQLKYDYKHADARIAAANAMKDAKATDADGNIVDESKLDIDSAKKVRRHAVEYLKAQNNGVLDKREYRALKGNDKNVLSRALDWIGGNDSHQKKMRKGIGADNMAAKTRRDVRFTIDDMKDAIGKRCPFLQENVTANGFENVTILEAAGLIKKDGDKYDITNLSMLVRKAIGPDATLNDHNDEAMRETQSIRTDLGQAFEKAGVSKFIDVSKLTNRDLRQLNDFCKYYDDRTHNIIVDTYKGIGIGGLVGASTGSSHIKQTQHSQQTLDFEYETGAGVNKAKLLDDIKKNLVTEGTGQTVQTFVETAKGIKIFVEQISDQEQFVGLAKSFLPATLLGTLIGSVAGGAIALVHAALTHRQEGAVLDPTKLSCFQTYEEAVAFVDSQKGLTQDQKRTLYVLLLQGVDLVKDENGIEKARTIEVTNPVTGEKECKIAWNIQCCNELNKLIRMGGNGIPNAQELELAAPKVQLHKKEVDKEDCDNNKGVTFVACEEETETVVETKKVDLPKVKFEDWGVFASRYECLGYYDANFKKVKDQNGKMVYNSYARTMMKVMQAIKDDNYDLDRLQELTRAAMAKNYDKLAKDTGFDLDTYKALRGNLRRNEFAMAELKLPTIKTKNGQMEEVTCNPGQPTYKAKITAGGKSTGKINVQDDYRKETRAGGFNGSLKASNGETYNTKNRSEYDYKKRQWTANGWTEQPCQQKIK